MEYAGLWTDWQRNGETETVKTRYWQKSRAPLLVGLVSHWLMQQPIVIQGRCTSYEDEGPACGLVYICMCVHYVTWPRAHICGLVNFRNGSFTRTLDLQEAFTTMWLSRGVFVTQLTPSYKHHNHLSGRLNKQQMYTTTQMNRWLCLVHSMFF